MPLTLKLLGSVTVSLLLAGAGIGAQALEAQPLITGLSYSFDSSTAAGASTFGDEDVAVDDLSGSISPVGLGLLPSNADLDAYHLRVDGARLFSLDVTVELPGLAEVKPSDVVSFDGSGYALVFSGSANGIPVGADMDALAMASNGDLLVSFDLALELSGILTEDRDLLRWDGSGWSVFFDGAGAGVPDGLDLDAAHVLTGDARLLLSFDGSGEAGGVSFDDEDVLEYDLLSHSWSIFRDGSAHWSEAGAVDLDALYASEEKPSAIFSDGFESGNTEAWSQESGGA